MTKIGTPLTSSAKKLLLLGSGELGKELVIEAQRFGCEVIAVDRYANAPAMQVAHRSHVINMLDPQQLREILDQEMPDLIVPEIEAIATDVLLEYEQRGFKVIPSARAVHLTMNREGIRRLAAEELGLPCSDYRFAETREEFVQAVAEVGLPCLVKPVMSSSGKGQSLLRVEADIDEAWRVSQEAGRSGAGKVIIEGFVDFDYEITLLTVRSRDSVNYCAPIGHVQENGDYQESWQPQPMSEKALAKAQSVAKQITEALGGDGIFGVEMFIKGDEVIFSEVSPRPHDTGMVTMISQQLSQFALHARAILGLPIHAIRQHSPSASHVIIVEGESDNVEFSGLDEVLSESRVDIRLFGKPEVKGRRRMGVVLASAGDIETARSKARRGAQAIQVKLDA